MTTLQRTLLLATLALASADPCAAAEQAPLTASQLREYCLAYRQEPGSALAQLCVIYVRGFLDGAAAADARVRKQARSVAESWLDRAQRTRLGERRGRPAFCIDADASIERIIARLVAHGKALDGALDAQELLARTVRSLYRC